MGIEDTNNIYKKTSQKTPPEEIKKSTSEKSTGVNLDTKKEEILSIVMKSPEMARDMALAQRRQAIENLILEFEGPDTQDIIDKYYPSYSKKDLKELLTILPEHL